MNINNLMEDAYASIYEKKKVSPAQQRANDNHYDGFEAAMASGATESQDDPECYTEYCKKNPIKKVKEEVELSEEGKKDACYHKVKSRYDVWPSAYASGALVKCRKKGAKNWGNSAKKEEMEMVFAFLMNEGFASTEDDALAIIDSMSDTWYDTIMEGLIES